MHAFKLPFEFIEAGTHFVSQFVNSACGRVGSTFDAQRASVGIRGERYHANLMQRNLFEMPYIACVVVLYGVIAVAATANLLLFNKCKGFSATLHMHVDLRFIDHAV